MDTKQTPDNHQRVLCIIPARYGSSRLPGKPLVKIAGKTLIERTCRQVEKAFPNYIVATDDPRIVEEVERFGGKARLTSPDHPSGTDRIAEVARDEDAEIIINVQGDEPFINPHQIEEVASLLLEEPSVKMATLVRRIRTKEDVEKKGVVKTVFDKDGYALYFSRATIPYPHHEEWGEWYEHVGIYGYRKDFLMQFVEWGPCKLEETESLEQLRALYHGVRIKLKITEYDEGALCIDTPEDVKKAEQFINDHPEFK